jgi:hypothetical protein
MALSLPAFPALGCLSCRLPGPLQSLMAALDQKVRADLAESSAKVDEALEAAGAQLAQQAAATGSNAEAVKKLKVRRSYAVPCPFGSLHVRSFRVLLWQVFPLVRQAHQSSPQARAVQGCCVPLSQSAGCCMAVASPNVKLPCCPAVITGATRFPGGQL